MIDLHELGNGKVISLADPEQSNPFGHRIIDAFFLLGEGRSAKEGEEQKRGDQEEESFPETNCSQKEISAPMISRHTNYFTIIRKWKAGGKSVLFSSDADGLSWLPGLGKAI